RFDEAFHLRDALGSQRQRFPARERLFVVSFGPEAPQDQRELRCALFERRLLTVEDHHRPVPASAPRPRAQYGALVRRRLVVEVLPLLPALARRRRSHQFHRPLEIGAVGGPRGGDGGRGVRRFHIYDGQVGIGFGRRQDNFVTVAAEGPGRR